MQYQRLVCAQLPLCAPPFALLDNQNTAEVGMEAKTIACSKDTSPKGLLSAEQNTILVVTPF
jgi:hypothetical protein